MGEDQRQKAAEQVDRKVAAEQEQAGLLRGLDEDSPDNREAKQRLHGTTDAEADVEQLVGDE